MSMRVIRKMRTIFFVCMIWIGALIEAQSVFILIHGTWGADCSWYVPEGDFFAALEETVCDKKSVVVPFRWSGGCGHDSRVKAAQNLIKLIKTYDEHTPIFIIAHSHGGNVVTLASHLLAQEEDNKHHIRALFTLGTPVMSNYLPNMKIIQYVYNLFSFEDIIQTVLGLSVREYPDHKRIANLRVMINGNEPDHAGLHHPLVGKWIAYIHKYFKQHLENKDIKDNISEPHIVHFDDDKEPLFIHDAQRNDLLERDRQLSVLILNSLRKSLETESNIPLTNL
jgi:hypothetical protein